MKTIIRAIPSRVENIKSFLPQLDNLYPEICLDKDGNAMYNFLRALAKAGNDSSLHLEDDIILTTDFENKAQYVIDNLPNTVIQFFSMRKKDLTIGSRFEPGSNFIMGQCFYLPLGMAADLLKYYDIWPRKAEHPTGLDLMIADYMQEHKMRYYIHCPNLVDHLVGKSAINPKRPTKRVSKTFIR